MNIEEQQSQHQTNEFGGQHPSRHLETFEMHGWRPSTELSDDENFMDMVILVTRNSHCKQGGMACVLVGPGDSSKTSMFESIISVSTNQPLFSENDSDVHAEIAALGKAARQGRRTENATAYITMPPCKRCFAALQVAGIRRIVSRLTFPKPIVQVAQKHHVALIVLGGMQEQRERINTLIHGDPNGKRGLEDKQETEERRLRRKEDEEALRESEERLK